MTNTLTVQNKYYFNASAGDFVISSFRIKPLILHDKIGDNDDLEFHLKSNDYFGTLATILDLMRQMTGEKIKKIEEMHLTQEKLIDGIKKELLHLQENYRIVKKGK